MIIAAFLAVLIGISLGMLGGGGSILAVPLLLYVVELGPRDAVATSLLVVGLASAAAMIPHARAGRVDVRVGLPFGVASMAGAFGGGRLAHLLPERLLLGGFTALVAITAVAMMRSRSPDAEAGAGEKARSSLGRASVVGIGIGMLTGLVGAGGGFVIVPALVFLCGLPMRAAVGTSLLVIAMNSLAGFTGTLGHASVPWAIAATIAAAAVFGSLAGATLAKRVPAQALRRGFAFLVLGMAIFMVWKQLPGAVTEALAEPAGLVLLLVAGLLLALLLVVRCRRSLVTTASSSPAAPKPTSH